MQLTVNGEVRQKGSTKTMVFGVAHLVWYCSQFMVMDPGDVIMTGTPPGVALGMKPPKFLKAGDAVHLTMDGLGEQSQKIVPFKL
jgi:2-keto-4-pentenoate hydratase/2-oxohepta-3-ene-1,7-dioic acid hydratase in catechol pathway